MVLSRRKRKLESHTQAAAESLAAGAALPSKSGRGEAESEAQSQKQKQKQVELEAKNGGMVDDLEARRSRKKEKKANRRSTVEGGEGKVAAGEEKENGRKKDSTRENQVQKKKKKSNKWGEKEPEQQQLRQEEQEVTNSGSEEQYEKKKVLVGGMPYCVSEDDIADYFSDCGRILEMDCVTFPDTGKFRGLVFITFETETAASKALAWDGSEMGGRYLKIQRCKLKPSQTEKPRYDQPPSKHQGCTSAYVGNLAWDVTEEELRDFFQHCKISGIRFAHDKSTGDFRGFGHVDFADDESLEAALALDQGEVHGRPIKIAYAVPKRN